MTAEVDPQILVTIIERELATISDERVLTQIRRLLVTPFCERRLWDYGEANKRFECWIVMRDPETQISLAYCKEGFGPRCPWGMLWDIDISLPHSSMGMDSSWHTTFLDVYFESRVPVRLPIWRVFEHEPSHWPGTAMTAEGSWDEAWKCVDKLRNQEARKRYDVWHSIR